MLPLARRSLRGAVVLSALLGALSPLSADPSPAPQTEETAREQEESVRAESAARAMPARPWNDASAQVAAPALDLDPAPFPLFVGIDDTAIPTYRIDVVTDDPSGQFSGYAPWGAAYDQPGHRVYFNSGVTAYLWTIGSGISTLGDITYSASPLAVVGLAFHNGKLYASKNTPNEAIYEVSTLDGTATIWSDYDDATYDFGGIAIDRRNGNLYGTNDTGTTGLYRISTGGVATLITAYPDGQTDIDGLAIGRGRAYLVTDQPGSIYVWNLDTSEWEDELTSPWATSETFAAATFIDNLLFANDFEAYPPNWSDISPKSCTGSCGGQAISGCYCDNLCVGFGDCCPDACSLCGQCL
jgi:hypothetical protein